MTSVSNSNMIHAAAGTSKTATQSNKEPVPCNWRMAKEGMSLLINNNEEEAITLFENNLECLEMFAGYATTLFMKGISTFEDDKVKEATVALNDLENRCSRNKTKGWFQNLRAPSSDNITYAERLERDICLGDAQMYLGILAFIGHDLKSYFRGGWLMRRAWKTYQRTYVEIKMLCRPILLMQDSNVLNKLSGSKFSQHLFKIGKSRGFKNPDSHSNASCDSKHLASQGNPKSKIDAVQIVPPTASSANGNVPIKNSPSSDITDNEEEHFESAMNENGDKKSQLEENKDCVSTEIETSEQIDSIHSSDGNICKHIELKEEGITNPISVQVIDDETLLRLLKGVSFGYGLLQLGMSLLPPAILKFTSIFGFNGDRKAGLSNLEFAKTGSDMRAPLATLSLLWYHTIARPFYALDGQNIQAGLLCAKQLIDENEHEYADSAFFLYFRGRLARLQANISEAIDCLKECINKSQQREMILIALHEIGWCYMIQLNYKMAKETFIEMQLKSRWAKAFYTYLAYLCTCIMDPLDSVKECEIVQVIFKNHQRRTPLDEFLRRRFNIILLQSTQPLESYWKLLLLEVLYLWNAFACVSKENIMEIIKVCEQGSSNSSEPMIGLSYLLMGSCYCVLRDTTTAKEMLRTGLALRSDMSLTAEDCHVTAYILYELGQLLIKDADPATKTEGIDLLQQSLTYKNYDFDQRLSYRVTAVLKTQS